jgi:hypothetical protein
VIAPFESSPENLDAAIEMAWEQLNGNVEGLIMQIADQLFLQPEQVRQLAVAALYYQLRLADTGSVVITAPRDSVRVHPDPLSAIAAMDESGTFRTLLDHLHGPPSGASGD